MQLPGMSTDPVRLSVDLTWWASDDDFSMSRRLWTRPASGHTWQLEDMATTASPIRLVTLPGRWRTVTDDSLRFFTDLVESQLEPFPDSHR
jgi:hypothetical protein